MDQNIRKLEKKDEYEIQQTMKSISGMDIEQWKWKFYGNPENNSKIWVVEDNKIIAGHMALQGINLNVGNQIIPGCQAVDLFIKENYRRKGLFTQLGKSSLDNAGQNGMSIAIGFPNDEALGGHLKYGWRKIGMIPRAFKPLDIDRYAASLKKHPLMIKFALKLTSREKILTEHNITIQKVETFSENIDTFTKQTLIGKNGVMRSSKYLNWRYCQSPHRTYMRYLATQNGEIKGYIIGYESMKCPGNGYIVDIMVKPGDKQIGRMLIRKLEEHFKTKNVFAVYSWVPNQREYIESYKDSGYIFRKPTQPFIVRVNKDTKEFEKIYSFEDWFITMGDSDLH